LLALPSGYFYNSYRKRNFVREEETQLSGDFLAFFSFFFAWIWREDGRLAMAAAMGLEAPETTAPTPPASRAPADDAVSIFRFERADIE